MKEIIPFIRPSISREDLKAVLETMVFDRVGVGELAERYVRGLAQQHQCVGGVIFRDLSTAIAEVYSLCAERQIRALLFSPLTDVRWIDAAREQEKLDIQYTTLVPETVIADYGQKIDACDCVVVENTLGYIPDYERITQSNKMTIELIGAGLGGIYRDKAIGTFGDIVVIDLESDQIITCGGGVAVLCRKEREWKILRKHAQQRGYRALIPDINAALGISQLHRLSQFIRKRKDIEEKYRHRMTYAKRFCYKTPFSKQHTPHSFPIRYQGNRRMLCKFALENGVGAQVAFSESAATNDFDNVAVGSAEQRANLDATIHQTVLFPLYPHLSSAHVQKIEQVIGNLP